MDYMKIDSLYADLYICNLYIESLYIESLFKIYMCIYLQRPESFVTP